METTRGMVFGHTSCCFCGEFTVLFLIFAKEAANFQQHERRQGNVIHRQRHRPPALREQLLHGRHIDAAEEHQRNSIHAKHGSHLNSRTSPIHARTGGFRRTGHTPHRTERNRRRTAPVRSATRRRRFALAENCGLMGSGGSAAKPDELAIALCWKRPKERISCRRNAP